jgi:hypothetical protein
VYFFGNFERCGQSAAKLLSKDEGSRIADQSHKVLCGDQILRFGLTLLNHQIRIAPRTTTHKTFVQDERAHWQARGARLRVRLKTRDSGVWR